MQTSQVTVRPGGRKVPHKQLKIKPGAIVYLDTNPLIYLTEGNVQFKASIASVFAAIDGARARLITSELALTEALVAPLRRQDTELIAIYERLFDNFVQALPISREVLLLTARLRALTPGLRTPDAIHVATATLANADYFVTGDAGIKGLPPSMQRIGI